jgi:hypothetical protein
MSNIPLYFIKKLTEHDLGISQGKLFARNCWFSLQTDPTLNFYQNIKAENITENENITFTYSYQLPGGLGLKSINLKARRKDNTLVFVLTVNSLAEDMQLVPNDILVIEQPSIEIFNVKILKINHPNYERINGMIGIDDKGKIRKRPIQICTNNNPFD